VPNQFIACMWTSGRRRKLKKLAVTYDAVIVLGCDAAVRTVEDSIGSVSKVNSGHGNRRHYECNSFGSVPIHHLSPHERPYSSDPGSGGYRIIMAEMRGTVYSNERRKNELKGVI